MDLEKKAEELAKNEVVATENSQTENSQTENSKMVVSNIETTKETLDKLQKQFFEKQIEKGNSLSDISIDLAKSKITSEIINDESEDSENYNRELRKEQKKTIKEGFKQDTIKQQAQTLSEKQKKAEAFYKSVRPILEFDFDNLIRNPHKNKEEKTYQDRSYGIGLMCLMLALLVIPYCIITIVLAVFNGINAVFESIATFGRIAKTITLSVFVIALGLLIIYCALLGVEALFNVDIIPNSFIP